MITIITITFMALMLIMTMGLLVCLILTIKHCSKLITVAIENKTQIDKLSIKHKYSIKESRDLLEYMVNQKLAEWQIYHIDAESENYITEDKMKDCIEYIIRKVMDELTEVSIDVLGAGYPMDTEEHQIESIKNRAKLAVLDYSIKQNTPKESGESLKNINAF